VRKIKSESEERERERGGWRSVRKILIYIYIYICWKQNPNAIFVIIGRAGRGGVGWDGSINIRPRPALSIGANFLNRNRPTTSMGRVKPARVGAGRCGSVQNCHL
jgi:hypothetical protein